LKKLILGLCFIIGLSCYSLAQNVAQKVGGLTYDLPAGWSAEARGNSVVLRPDDAVRSRICTVVITTGLPTASGFKEWVESQWTIAKGTRREVTRQDIPPTSDTSGMEAMAIAATLQIGNTPIQYHLFTGFRLGSAGSIMSFVTDGQDYLVRYENDVRAIASSIRYAAKTTEPALSGSGGRPPANEPAAASPSEEAEASKADAGPTDLPRTLPIPAPMPPGPPDMAARILARQVLSGRSESLPALMRAMLAAGHPIVRRDGVALYDPEPGNSNGVGMLDAELFFAAEAAKAGTEVTLGGLARTVRKNPAFHDFDILAAWKADLAELGKSTEPSTRFWFEFIRAMSTESEGSYADPASAAENSALSPVQAHMILIRSFAAFYFATNGTSTALFDHSMLLDRRSGGPFLPDAEISRYADPFARIRMADLARTWFGRDQQRSLQDAFRRLLERFPEMDERGANTWFAAMCQWMWILNHLELVVQTDNDPLVRTKRYLQRGATKEFLLALKLAIPRQAREHFESYGRDLGVSVSLPPDGQLPLNTDFPFTLTQKPLDPESAKLIEVKSLELPSGRGSIEPGKLVVEGAPQGKTFTREPVEDRRRAVVKFEIKADPGRFVFTSEWGRVASELGLVGSGEVRVPVTDWKDSSWSGQIRAEASGRGTVKIDEDWEATWNTERSFFTAFELDGSVPEGLIKQAVRTNPTARGPRKYATYYLKRNPQVSLRYEEYRKTRGPVENCALEKKGESTTTLEAILRDPKGFNEEVFTGTHRDVMIQRESVEDKWAVKIWSRPPPVPVSEKTQVFTTWREGGNETETATPLKTTDKVVLFFDRIRFKHSVGELVYTNPTVTRRPESGELIIEGGFRGEGQYDAGLPIKNSPGLNVHVEIEWRFRYVGEELSGAVASAADQALAFAIFFLGVENLAEEQSRGESGPTVKISSEVALPRADSCSLVEYRIAGKLKHGEKAADPALGSKDRE